MRAVSLFTDVAFCAPPPPPLIFDFFFYPLKLKGILLTAKVACRMEI